MPCVVTTILIEAGSVIFDSSVEVVVGTVGAIVVVVVVVVVIIDLAVGINLSKSLLIN